MLDFVSFKIAKQLRERGYRVPCAAHYLCLHGSCSLRLNVTNDFERGSNFKCFNNMSAYHFDAPTIAQAMKWLRLVKKKHVVIHKFFDEGYYWTVQDIEKRSAKIASRFTLDKATFQDYEDAALDGIAYCLDHLI